MALGKLGLGIMGITFGRFGYELGTVPGGGSNTDVIPANTAAPTISGTPQVGQRLTANNGTWTGSPAPTFAYQWYRGTTAISGANGSTYVPVSADQGTSLAVDVTGSNRAGEKTVRTAATSSIAAAPELKALVLSSATYRTTDPEGTVIGTITGLTAGSSLSLTPNDGRLAISRSGTTAQLVKGLSASSEGAFDVTFREELAGASNSPRETTVRLTVTNGSGAAQRTAPKRIAIFGDSFGQRAQDVTGSPSRCFAGRAYATATSATTEAGTLIVNDVSYSLPNGAAIAAITSAINGTTGATVVASSQSGRLCLTEKMRNRNVVVTQTVAGLNLPTGTYTPEITSTVSTDSVVNPVLFQWPYADTGTGGLITSTGVGGVTWSIANAIQALGSGAYTFPFEINRAVGGSNSGQCVRFVDDEDRLKQFVATLQEEVAAGRKVDGCLLNIGTNDTQATFTASSSYDNVKSICERITALGIPVVLYTIAPRGEPAFTSARLGNVSGTDKRPMAREFNARILGTSFNGTSYPGLAAEASLSGKVRVVDITTPLLDPAPAVDFDILPAFAYDGLHLSPLGCFTVAPALLAAFDAMIPASVTAPLATSDNAGNVLGTKGLMAGTSGTLTRAGNATTNAGFTLSGQAPTGWLVATSSNWPGTDPNNTKGTVAVSKGTADVGEALVLDATLDGSGRSNANSYRLELSTDIDMTQFASGEFLEALAKLKLSGLSGFRSADIQLILTEPDGVVRTLRTHAPPPNGTLRPDWPQTDRTLILRTQRRRVKSGTYGSAKLLIALNFAGNAAGIALHAELSQAAVRKAPFPT